MNTDNQRAITSIIKAQGGVLVEKAWAINPHNFKEPHFAPDGIFHATSPGQAKLKILREIRYEDHKTYTGDDITFLNIKIKRAPSADTYKLGEQTKSLSQIQYELEVKERNEKLEKLIQDNPGAKAYIAKGGLYYRPGSCGYTERLVDAGVYSIEHAAREVRGCSLGDHMRVAVIKTEEHNKMINDKIEDLKSRLI